MFYYHLLVRKKNLKRFERRLMGFKDMFAKRQIERETIIDSFQGWTAYIMHANTYKYRRHLIRLLNSDFPAESPPSDRKQENFTGAVIASNIDFSANKTLKLFRAGKAIPEIARERGIRESTVWSHLAKLTEYGLLSVYGILPEEKIRRIQSKIREDNDTLKLIKSRLDDSVSYDEIQCVVASLKRRKSFRSNRSGRAGC